MKIQHLLESVDPKSVGYRTDNPGGEWLESKKRIAAERYRENGSLANGSITATIGMHKKAMIKTSHIANLPGARGEHEFRHGGKKYDDLAASVKENGWNAEDAIVMIFIGFNGEAQIGEGNHRMAYAVDHNIEWIRCDLRYWAGGEREEGILKPEKLFSQNLVKPFESQS